MLTREMKERAFEIDLFVDKVLHLGMFNFESDISDLIDDLDLDPLDLKEIFNDYPSLAKALSEEVEDYYLADLFHTYIYNLNLDKFIIFGYVPRRDNFSFTDSGEFDSCAVYSSWRCQIIGSGNTYDSALKNLFDKAEEHVQNEEELARIKFFKEKK